MPVSNELLTAVQTQRFWPDYTFDTEPQSAGIDYSFSLPVAKRYAIRLSFDDEFLGIDLGFAHPGGTSELGWDDQAHFHPHVLRWDELELISRASAKLDPRLQHPGITILLLSRFSPICGSDDIEHIRPIVRAAWRTLGILNDDQIESELSRYDCRLGGFVWKLSEPLGWTIHQSEEDFLRSGIDLYTTRCAENPSFAFEQWNQLIAAARETVK